MTSSAKKGLEPREMGLIAAALSLVADQGFKLFMLYGAFTCMSPGRSVPVLPFFNLVMVWNPGISYGLFPASGRLGNCSCWLACRWRRWPCLSWLVAVARHQPFAGHRLWPDHRRRAGQHLVDRLIYGKVADFFHFYGFGYDWYVFNIADLAITLGAVAILYDVLQADSPRRDPGQEV